MRKTLTIFAALLVTCVLAAPGRGVTVTLDQLFADTDVRAFTLTIDNFDMATRYNLDSTAGNDVDANNLVTNGFGSQALGSRNLDDFWGVLRVTSITGIKADGTLLVATPGLNGPITVTNPILGGDPLIVQPGDGPHWLGMIYGGIDFFVGPTGIPLGGMVIDGTGLRVDIYEVDAAPLIDPVPPAITNDPYFFAEDGSAGRTGFDLYPDITDGDLILQMQSVAGHLNAEVGGVPVDGGLIAEYKRVVTADPDLENPTVPFAGAFTTYLEVIGGTKMGDFDLNGFNPLEDAYGSADILLTFGMSPHNPALVDGTADDWLAQSEGIMATATPLPTGAWIGLVGLALIGAASRFVTPRLRERVAA